MSEQWEFYECAIEDQRAFVSVDIGYFDRAPMAGLAHEIRIEVEIKNPREDGLNTTEERPELDAIEDSLQASFEGIGGVYVGRATFGGKRRHYFYVPSMDDVGAALGAVANGITDRSIDGDSFEDPAWSQYLEFLYPNSLGWRYIVDRRVVRALEENGDSIDVSRCIDHFANFPSAKSRDAYVDLLTERGMTIDDTDNDGEGKHPYSVSFSQDQVPMTIFPVTCELMQLAESLDGSYDGWGCDITTAE